MRKASGWIASVLFSLAGCSSAPGIQPAASDGESQTSAESVGSASNSASNSDGSNSASNSDGSDSASNSDGSDTAGTETSATTADATSTSATTDDASSGDDTTSGGDDTGTSSSGDDDASTTAEEPQGYGPCASEACGLDDEVCLTLPDYHMCAMPCDTVADCPPMPTGGSAVLECRLVSGQTFDACFLNCASGTCPPPMVCNPNDACSWM